MRAELPTSEATILWRPPNLRRCRVNEHASEAVECARGFIECLSIRKTMMRSVCKFQAGPLVSSKHREAEDSRTLRRKSPSTGVSAARRRQGIGTEPAQAGANVARDAIEGGVEFPHE